MGGVIAKHTPGPWTVRPGVCRNDHPDTSADVHGRDGQFVADCGCHEQATANACLIAAAPELLAAVQVILEEPHGCPFCDSGRLRTPNNPAKSHTENCGFYLAERAIAKAEGR